MQTSSPRSTGARLLSALCVTFTLGCSEPEAEWTRESIPEPAIFAEGIISSADRDYGITFTPDGREAYFTRRSRRGPSRIYVVHFTDDSWTQPALAGFSMDRDESPFLSRDGSTMLFTSRRPAPGTMDRSENIWIAERRGGGWTEPVLLPGAVNRPRVEMHGFSTGSERSPALLESGSLLYSTRTTLDWGSDLYVAEPGPDGTFEDPRPLRINSYGDESNPAMSPDGRYLVFQRYGTPDAMGEQDLYVSERTAYGWSDPRPLPAPINSVLSDGWPSFSPNGRHFFFASDRARGRGYYDVYRVDIEALGLGSISDRSVSAR
jgi:Tol biopolymer transport system component